MTGFEERLKCLLRIGLLRVIVSLTIEEVVLASMVRLRLLTLIRIHSVVNVSWVVKYKELVKKQRVEKPKPIKVEEAKE